MAKRTKRISRERENQMVEDNAAEKMEHERKMEDHKQDIAKRKQVFGEKWYELHPGMQGDTMVTKILECQRNKAGDLNRRFVGNAHACKDFIADLKAQHKKTGVQVLYNGKRESA